MSKLILFTGVGALLLGVAQNLPQTEVIQVDYPSQIQSEYESMEQRLNSVADVPLDINPRHQPSLDNQPKKEAEIWNINKYPKPVSDRISQINTSSQIPEPQQHNIDILNSNDDTGNSINSDNNDIQTLLQEPDNMNVHENR